MLPPLRTVAVVALALLLCGAGPAPVRLSIEEALRRAEATSQSVAAARAALERARGVEQSADSRYFPELSAQASYQRQLIAEIPELIEDVSGDGGDPPPDEQGGGSDALGRIFANPDLWRAGLVLNYPLWTGGRLSAADDRAESALRQAEVALDTARAQALLDTASTYYDAVLAGQLLVIAEEGLEQAERTLAQVEEGRRVGAQPEFELLRARVARDNARPTVVQRRVELRLAKLRLVQLLELPPAADVELTSGLQGEPEPLEPVVGPPPGAPEEVLRAPVVEAREQVRQIEAVADQVRSQRWPSLVLTSNFFVINRPDDFAPVPLSRWNPDWTAALTLSVPLFTGGRISGDVRAAEADVVAAQVRLRQVEQQARVDTVSAVEQLQASRAVFDATGGTVEQAERAYEIAEVRYAEGISTQLELSDARLQLEQARANRARAARDLQVARVRVALLPRLPLGPGGATAGQLQPLPGQFLQDPAPASTGAAGRTEEGR